MQGTGLLSKKRMLAVDTAGAEWAWPRTLAVGDGSTATRTADDSISGGLGATESALSDPGPPAPTRFPRWHRTAPLRATQVEALANRVADALAAHGLTVDRRQMRDVPVAYCQGCFECWTHTPVRVITQERAAPGLRVAGDPLACPSLAPRDRERPEMADGSRRENSVAPQFGGRMLPLSSSSLSGF